MSIYAGSYLALPAGGLGLSLTGGNDSIVGRGGGDSALSIVEVTVSSFSSASACEGIAP
jgi:hypothetical protein